MVRSEKNWKINKWELVILSESESGLNEMLKVVSVYTEENSLTINGEKLSHLIKLVGEPLYTKNQK